jgi:broad specificity phosphatase PhoE
MAKLISARHGDYDSRSLNEEGREQIKRLAASIYDVAGEVHFLLVSSAALRAVQSSEIIADKLGIPDIEKEIYIWDAIDVPSDKKHETYLFEPDGEKLMRLVGEWEARAEGALIIVSHGHMAELIATEFGEKYGIAVPEYKLKCGEAVYVDPETKSHRLLPGK